MKRMLSTAAAIALGVGVLGGAAFAGDTASSGAAATAGQNHTMKKGDHHRWVDKAFEKQDANKDGKVSEDEFVNHMKEKFKKADADGDGSVTKEEAQKYAESMHEKRRARHKDHMKSSTTTTGGTSATTGTSTSDTDAAE